MSYDYKTQKKNLFTEEAMANVLKLKEKAYKLIHKSGCVRLDYLLDVFPDTWDSLAAIDYLLQHKFLLEIKQSNITAQQRIFIKPQ